jgi:hypothetical protein
MIKDARSGDGGAGKANAATPGPATPDAIAAGLRQLFAPLAAEPVPDEFLALLDRIDANARKGAGLTPPPRGQDGSGLDQ